MRPVALNAALAGAKFTGEVALAGPSSTQRTKVTRGLSVANAAEVSVANITAKGAGSVAFSKVRDVRLSDADLDGHNVLIDWAENVTIERVKIRGLKNAAAINGRRQAWKSLTVRDCDIGDSVNGDGIHPAAGQQPVRGRDYYATVTPFTFELVDLFIHDLPDAGAHTDAFQVTAWSKDGYIHRCHFKLMQSWLQVTPVQNGAKRAGTGSGESTGVGRHDDLVIEDVLAEDAGAGRFFCCPRLRLLKVITQGRSTVDLRHTQYVATDKDRGWGWRKQHPESDWTHDVVMQECRIGRLIVHQALFDDLDRAFDRSGCGDNSIDVIQKVDAKTNQYVKPTVAEERSLRAILQ